MPQIHLHQEYLRRHTLKIDLFSLPIPLSRPKSVFFASPFLRVLSLIFTLFDSQAVDVNSWVGDPLDQTTYLSVWKSLK